VLPRVPGWEARLAAAVESARLRPYQLGEHDCLRFACAVEFALTGRDRWHCWAGQYRTARRAKYLIAKYGNDVAVDGAGVGDSAAPVAQGNDHAAPGELFTRAASRWFGGGPQPMALARRGDVCEYRTPDGEQHLGVVIGAQVVVLMHAGLAFVPRTAATHAWRVGE